jgi:glyoxylase-like metal-dependent hydrolase (beta-lactamase superfamily II)/ferredoxin
MKYESGKMKRRTPSGHLLVVRVFLSYFIFSLSYFLSMAHPSRRRPENVPGDFFVDDTCIDCDACRALAPGVFAQAGGQSAVIAQPRDAAERRDALRALTACPTASIGTVSPAPDLGGVRREFPVPVDGAGEVFYCGYHSENSFGAASWFIPNATGSASGNVLVDCPREASALMTSLEARGGVSDLFLTHGDDVADHAAYHDRFGCARRLHAGDRQALPGAEIVIEGAEPVAWGPDLIVIPVPGHTRGSCCLLYKGRYLFTGDHLAFSPRRGHLYAFRDACWYSWEEQIKSMERLLDYSFEWVLPGHGRKVNLPASEMRKSLETCIAWMKAR